MEHNPDPVTEYVRDRLRQAHAQDERGAVQAIEKKSGLGPGHVFKIKNDDRARVTSKTAQALAPVFGFHDYGDFLEEVVKWWKTEGQKRIGAWSFVEFPELEKDAEARVAIEMAKGSAGVVPEIVAAAFADHRVHIGSGKHDRYWWVARFGESAKLWQDAKAKDNAEKKTEKKAKRELAKARKEAPESTRSLAGEPPSVAPSEPKIKRERSRA